MREHRASRTLVKSPPELWAECSDAASLARHLDAFKGIRITRLEPETAVAWEGEQVSGTVRLEPSGWGTKVILTATGGDDDEPPPPQEPEPHPAPSPLPPAASGRRGLLARMRALLRAPASASAQEPAVSEGEQAAEQSPEAVTGPREAALSQALDSLGQAHHRPFSRA